MNVQRVAAYLDQRPEPLVVLERAPFRFQLDAGALGAGSHVLRLEIVHADGSREERSHLFEVSAGEALALEDVGFLPGRGVITIDVSGELEPAARAPSTGLVLALVVGTLLLITVGVQGFVVLGSRAAGGGAERAALPLPEVAVRTPASGAALYLEHCASCHLPDGSGIAGVFPALLGVGVANADSVITQVLQGRGAMPAFADWSDADVAAVVTHARSAWGNRFGPVSPAEVAARR